MATSFGPSMMERFAARNFGPIDFDGLTVHPMYRRSISAGDAFTVEWISVGSPRPQGVSLRLRNPDKRGRAGEGGSLEVNGRQSPSFVLWRDSSPDAIETRCVEACEGAELWVSNCWRQADGREDEWLNNFGVLVEERGSEVLLRCSDGNGAPPTFTDLVVRLAFPE